MSEPQSTPLDENLTPEIVHNTRRSLLEWIQASPDEHRSRTTLPSLPLDTLNWGIKWLRNHLASLAEQDMNLYSELLELLPDSERSHSYCGYEPLDWQPSPEEPEEQLTKKDAQWHLNLELVVYDEVLGNVNFWKREIERLKKERAAQRMDLNGPVFDNSDKVGAKDSSS